MSYTIKALSAKITGLNARSKKFNKDLDDAIVTCITLLVDQDKPCVNQANRLVELVNAPTKPKLIAYLRGHLPYKFNREKGFTKQDKSKIADCKAAFSNLSTFSEWLNADKDSAPKKEVDYFVRAQKSIDTMLKKADGVAMQVSEIDALMDLLNEKRKEVVASQLKVAA